MEFPELSSRCPSIRISPEVDVPVTPRVKRLIDTAAFRRLARVSQLGLVSTVYPGATHTRFEHSLGVYRNAVHFVQHLRSDPVFQQVIAPPDAETFIVAALFHDLGHWPFCHAIEDLQIPGIPHHENIALPLLSEPPMAELLEQDWNLTPVAIAKLLFVESENDQSRPAETILRSMLSGPIDIDKLDYLERDSTHAGVPYGRNFDRSRLIRALCIHPETLKLSIGDKGKTAAEMMVFARYIMFSEVYWHHAVRSATAMLQRTVYELFQHHRCDATDVLRWAHATDHQVIEELLSRSRHELWESCAAGIFGPIRNLYKRIAQFDYLDEPLLHRSLSRRPYAEITTLSRRLSQRIASLLPTPVSDFDVLIDAPSHKLDVQFQMEVRLSQGVYRQLGDVSPMVQALATKQFDDIVKRVRIFANPTVATAVRESGLDVRELIADIL
jgi:HD superfamily phosphohydrolase